MTPLSPAAQAVRDAFFNGPDDFTASVAAALQVAADRTESLISDTPHPKFAEGVLAAGDFLERIAAELDGGATTPTES